MLEEQQGNNSQLADQLALKEDQITQMQRGLDLRKAQMQGATLGRDFDLVLPNSLLLGSREWPSITLCLLECAACTLA